MSTETPLSSRVQTGTALAAGGFAFTQLLTLASYLVLARLVSPSTFGTVAAATILLSTGVMFAESGMSAALIQWRGDIESAAASALVATVVGGVILGVVAAISAPLIGLVFASHEVTVLAVASAGIIVIHAFALVPNALMQRNLSFARRVIVEPAAALAFGGAAIGACSVGLGAWGLLLGSYASATVLAILSWTLVRWRPRLMLASFAVWRQLASFGRHVLASEILARGGTVAETTLVGRFLGPGPLGQYRYGYRLASQPLAAWVNIAAFVLLPSFCRMSDDVPRLQRAFLRSLRWMAGLMVPVSVLAVPLGSTVAVALFGPRWREAGVVLSSMAAFSAAYGFVSIISEIWKAVGRPDLLPKINVIRLSTTVILMVVLLPLGLQGIGLALSISALLTAAYALQNSARVLGITHSAILDEVWGPLVAAIVAGAVVFVLANWAFPGATTSSGGAAMALLWEVPSASIVYLAGLAVTARRLRGEVLGRISAILLAIRRPTPRAESV